MWSQVQQALNDSSTRVITGMANLLPGFVALVLAVLIAGVLAWAAGFVIRRFLRRVDLDDKLARASGAGMAAVSPGFSPTLLLIRLVRSTILFVGLLIGVAAFDPALTSGLVGQFFAFLPRLVTSAILLLVGNVVARYLSRAVLIGAVNMNIQYARLLSAGVKWLMLVFIAAMALNHVGIGGQIVGEAFAILFGGITLALALAVGLGAQGFVSRTLEQQGSDDSVREEEPFHHI